jgi:hypothetical protein
VIFERVSQKERFLHGYDEPELIGKKEIILQLPVVKQDSLKMEGISSKERWVAHLSLPIAAKRSKKIMVRYTCSG